MMNRIRKQFGYVLAIVLLPLFLSEGAGFRPVEGIYDFGEVAIDFRIYHKFKLVNGHNESLRFDSVIVNCDCSSVWVDDSTVLPGDTVTIRLEFSTTDYYGRTSKAVKIYSNAPSNPNLELFYLSTVGQWFMGMKPNPISLFFLPGRDSIRVEIPNPALGETKLVGVDAYDDRVTTKIVREQAAKGDKLMLDVFPQNGLPKGTYHTSLRLTFKIAGFDEPTYKTLPVKIVRY